jgi:hypothetical protein
MKRIKGSQKLTLPYQTNKQITVKQILNHFQIEIDKNPKEIIDPDLQRELLVLEEQEGSINFKFGIVYAKNGQLTDDEMLSNGSKFRILNTLLVNFNLKIFNCFFNRKR